MPEVDLPGLEGAVMADPENGAAWVALGTAYLGESRPNDAHEAFREAIQREPGAIEAWLGLARAAHGLGRRDEVEQAVAQAFDLDAGCPELYRVVCDTSDLPDQLPDRLVGAARYIALAASAPDRQPYLDLIVEALRTVAEFEPWRAADLDEVLPFLDPVVPVALLNELKEGLREARAKAETVGDYHPELNERLVAATALLAEDPLGALAAFQDLITEIGVTGDDREPPLAELAATAYNGLAQALLACPAAGNEERATHLELALEAAVEAEQRAPEAEQPYRAGLLLELSAVREGTDGNAAYAYEGAPAPEPVIEPSVEAAVDATADAAVDAAGDTPAGAPEAPVEVPPPVVEVAEPAAMPEVGVTYPEPEPQSAAAPPRVVMAEAEVLAILSEAFEAADTGDRLAARAAFDDVLERVDDRRLKARAKAGLALCDLGDGVVDQVMQRTEEALSFDSDCGEAHLVRGLLAERRDDWERAFQAYQFAEATMPADGRVLRGLGLALCEREEWQAALSPLSAAHEARPDDALIVAALGRCFARLRQLPQAEACYEAALSMDLPDALRNSVVVQLEQVRGSNPAASQGATVTASAEPEEYDPDTAHPEQRRPDDDDRRLRDRVLKRASGGPEFDPELHEKCRVCRYPNDLGAERCARCGNSMAAPPPPEPQRPCFVATAACGDAWAPEVVALRTYRDTVLCQSRAGRWAIRCYDRWSPPLARAIAGRRWLAAAVRRWLIAPLAARVDPRRKAD